MRIWLQVGSILLALIVGFGAGRHQTSVVNSAVCATELHDLETTLTLRCSEGMHNVGKDCREKMDALDAQWKADYLALAAKRR